MISLFSLAVRVTLYALALGVLFMIWFVREILVPAVGATVLMIRDGWSWWKDVRQGGQALESGPLHDELRDTFRLPPGTRRRLRPPGTG